MQKDFRRSDTFGAFLCVVYAMSFLFGLFADFL